MLVACWSVKGGVGTTVVAAVTAVGVAGRRQPALLVDLAGDAPVALGVEAVAAPGVAEWLAVGAGAPPDALARLEVPVRDGLHLLPRGRGPLDPTRVPLLIQVLASSGRTVVVDCGRIDGSVVAHRVAAQAHRSLLVTRLCRLAVARAATATLRPSGVVVVREPGRHLTVADVESVVGAPVVADVAVDPSIARAVDAGLGQARVPRSLVEALGTVAA